MALLATYTLFMASPSYFLLKKVNGVMVKCLHPFWKSGLKNVKKFWVIHSRSWILKIVQNKFLFVECLKILPTVSCCESLLLPDAFSWGVGAFFPGRKVFLEVPSTIKLSHLIDSQGWYLGALSQTFAQSLPCSISWTFKKCTSIRFYYSEGSCIKNPVLEVL